MTAKWDGTPRRRDDPLIMELSGKMDVVVKFIEGDPMASPPIKGLHDRLCALELEKIERDKGKDKLMDMATGTVAIAAGGIVLWIGSAIRTYFIKPH